MVGFYLKRIKDGKMELSDVPSRWYDAVALAVLSDN